MLGDDTKQCPYCAETIKAAAVVCRYCGRDLIQEKTNLKPEKTQPVTTTKQSTKKNNKLYSVIKLLMVALIGTCLACYGLVFLGILLDDSSPSETNNNSNSEIAETTAEPTRTPRPTTRPNPTNTAEPTATPQPTATPIPTDTPIPQPTTPPIEEILAALENMTDAQSNNYMENLEGSRVEGWEGEVTEVDEGAIFGGFTVFVDMVDNNFGSEVVFDVTEEIALSLNIGQRIRFSGDVELVSDFFGETVYLENVTIELLE